MEDRAVARARNTNEQSLGLKRFGEVMKEGHTGIEA
jgi:hypothetical protein